MPRLQVYLLLFLTLLLALYHFTQPYKSPVANALELVVQLDFLLLLLLVSSAILEPFYGLPLQGTVSSNDTCGGHDVGVAGVVWFLTPFYYFPVLLLMGVVVMVCIRKLHTAR